VNAVTVKRVRCRTEILGNASKALPVTPLRIGRRKSDKFSISLIALKSFHENAGMSQVCFFGSEQEFVETQ